MSKSTMNKKLTKENIQSNKPHEYANALTWGAVPEFEWKLVASKNAIL
jgi:hypothetical protein